MMPMFANDASPWYIPNLCWASIFAAVVSGVTCFQFMQIFAHTADTLLYAFAWNRELSKANYKDFRTTKYCPGAMRDMMPEYELEPGEEMEPEQMTTTEMLKRAAFEYPFRQWHQWRAQFGSMASTQEETTADSGTLFGSMSTGFQPEEKLPMIEESGEDPGGKEALAPTLDSARELSFR